MLLHAVPFKIVPLQLETVSLVTVPLLEVLGHIVYFASVVVVLQSWWWHKISSSLATWVFKKEKVRWCHIWGVWRVQHVMPLWRNSRTFRVYVHVWQWQRKGNVPFIRFFFPLCLHIHVERVDMLFCALSLWNALLMHNSMHARMIGVPFTLEQAGLPQAWQCHSLGRQLPCCHWGGPDLVPGQFIYSLWWAKWHWDRFFSKYYDSPLSLSYHQYLCIRLSLMLYNCSTRL